MRSAERTNVHVHTLERKEWKLELVLEKSETGGGKGPGKPPGFWNKPPACNRTGNIVSESVGLPGRRGSGSRGRGGRAVFELVTDATS